MTSAPIANCGWMPDEMARLDESWPDQRILVAPDTATPTETYCAVSVPPEHCGNWMSAVLLTWLPLTVQPRAERATAWRA